MFSSVQFCNLALVPVQASGSVDGFVCAYDVCILIFFAVVAVVTVAISSLLHTT